MLKKITVVILICIINISCQDRPEFTDVINVITVFNKNNPDFKPFELTSVEKIDIFNFNSAQNDDQWFVKCEGKESDVIIFLIKKNTKNLCQIIWNSEYEKQWGSQLYSAESIDIDSDGNWKIQQNYDNMNRGRSVKSISIVKFVNIKPTIVFESIWESEDRECSEDLVSGDTMSLSIDYSFIDKNNDKIFEIEENKSTVIFLSYKNDDDYCEINDYAPPRETKTYFYSPSVASYIKK